MVRSRFPAIFGSVILAALALGCSPSPVRDDAAGDEVSGRDDSADVDAPPPDDADAGDVDDGPSDGDPDVRPDADDATDADSDALDDGTDDGDGGPITLPTGCSLIRPTSDIAFGWAGRTSIDAGAFVWRWIDTGSRPSESVLMIRDLATAADRELLRRTYPEMAESPAVFGDSVAVHSPLVEGGGGEIFQVSTGDGSIRQLTHSDLSDGFPMAGAEFFVYDTDYDLPGPGDANELRYVDLTDNSEHFIYDREPACRRAFDGRRWVTFSNSGFLFKFDLLDPGAGARQVSTSPREFGGMGFDRDTGVVVMSAQVSGASDDYRLEAWDLTTDTMTVLLDEPWTQDAPDVDGHVVVYQDSQASGESFWPRELAEVRVLDRDTGAIRVVMPLDTYYGVGIWERWIALNNYGMFGDSLIVCDLVEGGFMSDDLHVLPE